MNEIFEIIESAIQKEDYSQLIQALKSCLEQWSAAYTTMPGSVAKSCIG